MFWYVCVRVHLFHPVIFDDLIVCLAVGIYCYFVWKQLQITIHLHVIHFGKPLRSKKKKIVVFVKSDLEGICAYISMCFSLYICNCIVRQDLFQNYFIRFFDFFWFLLNSFHAQNIVYTSALCIPNSKLTTGRCRFSTIACMRIISFDSLLGTYNYSQGFSSTLAHNFE